MDKENVKYIYILEFNLEVKKKEITKFANKWIKLKKYTEWNKLIKNIIKKKKEFKQRCPIRVNNVALRRHGLLKQIIMGAGLR